MCFCFSFIWGETEQQLSDLVEVKSVSGSEHELTPMTSGTEGMRVAVFSGHRDLLGWRGCWQQTLKTRDFIGTIHLSPHSNPAGEN